MDVHWVQWPVSLWANLGTGHYLWPGEGAESNDVLCKKNSRLTQHMEEKVCGLLNNGQKIFEAYSYRTEPIFFSKY